jgi:cyclophilin family peptidyl-prolyl cis-trans isomerase
LGAKETSSRALHAVHCHDSTLPLSGVAILRRLRRAAPNMQSETQMRIRLIASMVLGLALAATPAYSEEEDAAVAQESKPTLSTAVNPDVAHDPDNVLYLDLSTGQRVAIRLKPEWAPNHVERIKVLTRQGFYDGVTFHRVIDGFMAQTGDPTGTGAGGSQLPDLEAEFNSIPHMRGMVSMARTDDPNSANSQFFIVFYPRFSLDKKYTVFGRVIGGMSAVDAIQRGEPPQNPTKIVQASLASEGRRPPAPVAATNSDASISVADLNASESD